MTTRRTVGGDKSVGKEDNAFAPPAGKSNIAPAVPTHVIVKLLGFTLAMVVGPIGSYFLTLHTIYGGNSTYAGATAAIMANVVLVGYVIVAFREDQSEAIEKEKENESKKQS